MTSLPAWPGYSSHQNSCNIEEMELKVVVHPAEEGGFWAEIPALPGCATQGDTMPELMERIKEAAEGWLNISDNDLPAGDVYEIAV